MRDAFTAFMGLPPEGVWPAAGRLRLVINSHGIAIPEPSDGRPRFYALVLRRGSERPNGRRVPCNDAGRDGDEAAGDGFWTCVIEVAAGECPEVGVLVPGLTDLFPAMRSDLWLLNGVHLLAPGPPAADELTVRVGAPNLCAWPDLVLGPDPIHPSPAGCVVMARAVADRIVATDVWQNFVR